MGVSIEVNMPDLESKFQGFTRELYLFIAAQIQTNRGFMFAKEGAHNSHPKWNPLVFRKGMILSNKGTLRKSIAPTPARGQPGNDGVVRISGEKVTVGTNLFYAKLMNDGTTKMPGGVLTATKAKALKIPVPGGERATGVAKGIRKKQGDFIFRKSVKIPARPFDQINSEDAKEIGIAVRNKLAKMLNR